MALIITGEGTSSNTANAIVRRDNNGDFNAGTITANLSGSVTGNISGSSTSCTGNAASVTNGVYTTGSYSDPSWIVTIAASKINGTVSSATTATSATSATTATSATSATNTTNVAVDTDITTTTAYLSFVTDTTGNKPIKVNTNITCNASLGTITAQCTNARYADLAEKYVSDDVYEPGTVLQLGGLQEVTLAENETRRVAGVVSTWPGFVMNEECQGEFVVLIALQGRVPCKVVGSVRKGDMMISAGHGYAKSCEEPKLGQVIGKSLEDFHGESGVIEVLVGRL